MVEKHNCTEWVHEMLKNYPLTEQSLIMVLQEINRHYNYLPLEALKLVSESLNVPESKVFSVSTFYKAFSLDPRGKVIIRVCLGTACHIRGGQELVAEASRILNLKPGETTPDGMFTLETVNCVGACAMAPLIVVGDKYHGNLNPSDVREVLEGGNSSDSI